MCESYGVIVGPSDANWQQRNNRKERQMEEQEREREREKKQRRVI